MKLVFTGTAQFAIPTLKTLLEHHNVLAVITAPDKPAGRGQKIKPSPIKEVVLECIPPLSPPCKGGEQRGVIPLFTQPVNKLAKQLTQLKPDIIIVAAYGQFLGKEILAIPRFGCWNIHPSLLPKYRGASPIQAAILNGDAETGVSIIQMNEKLDAGPIIAQERTQIAPQETAGSLHEKLALLGAQLLQTVLTKINKTYILYSMKKMFGSKKKLFSVKSQDETVATYTKKITPDDAQLDFKKPAYLLERKVRAYNPLPGAYVKVKSEKLKVKGLRLKIWKAEIKKDADASGAIQTSFKNISLYQKCPALICGDGEPLILTHVQPEGKKRMSGEEFARGYMI